MNILFNILTPILILLFSYLIGSIPTGVIISNLVFHKDVRKFGSGNSGGTNVGRTFGKKWGLLTIILDMIKTIVPVWATWAFLTYVPMYQGAPLIAKTAELNQFGLCPDAIIQYPVYWLAAIGVSFGHCFSCFIRFQGGKAAASFMGLVIGTCWGQALVNTLYFAFLKWKKYVSLAAIASCILSTLFAWTWTVLVMTGVIPPDFRNFIGFGNTLNINFVYAIAITVLSGLVILRHKPNIERIIAGTERKISWMK